MLPHSGLYSSHELSHNLASSLHRVATNTERVPRSSTPAKQTIGGGSTTHTPNMTVDPSPLHHVGQQWVSNECKKRPEPIHPSTVPLGFGLKPLVGIRLKVQLQLLLIHKTMYTAQDIITGTSHLMEMNLMQEAILIHSSSKSLIMVLQFPLLG